MRRRESVTWRSALGAIALCSLAACGAKEADLRLPAEEFAGVRLSGSAADAKALGYRACEAAGSDYYLCSSPDPSPLFGVKAQSVSVSIQNGPPQTFNGVSLKFEAITYDRTCELVDPADPNACAIDPKLPLAQFERRLIADGWRASRKDRSEREYFKAGELVSISVSPGSGGVHLRGVYGSYLENQLAEIAEEAPVQFSDPQAERQAFIDEMAR